MRRGPRNQAPQPGASHSSPHLRIRITILEAECTLTRVLQVRKGNWILALETWKKCGKGGLRIRTQITNSGSLVSSSHFPVPAEGSPGGCPDSGISGSCCLH